MKKIIFLGILKSNGITYEFVGKTIKINEGYVYLSSLTSLPENVQFNNGGYVYLNSLTSLPENVQFNNGGDVYLNSLTSLPENVQFNNGGDVDLRSLTSLPENVQFNNGGYVDLRSLTSLPENVQFNNGGDVYLSSLTSLPENVQFNNGGDVYLISLKNKPYKVLGKRKYLTRFKIKITNRRVILYKRVSKDFKTQEETENETLWLPKTTVTIALFRPENQECGENKYHACAKPFWCDTFRKNRGDKYVAIKIGIDDLFEWTESPQHPKKIAFRSGKVLYECDRFGKNLIPTKLKC
jgi:hypothetical protein